MRIKTRNPIARSLFILLCASALSAQGLLPPLLFENHEPGYPKARFILQDSPFTVYFEDTQILLRSAGQQIRLQFPGQNTGSSISAQSPQPGRLNLIVGSDLTPWARDLPLYGGLVYHDLYSGIDMRWRMHDHVLKSEFVLAPGADVNAIRLHYAGMDAIEIDRSGDLLLRTAAGVIREKAPVAYTINQGVSKKVGVSFRLLTPAEISFTVEPYDTRAVLVIDPVLTFSTFLGGSGFTAATSVAADSTGNVYVGGWTESVDLPSTGGLPRGSGIDAFVAKFTPSNVLAYCTYFGGAYEDRITGLAVDASGNAVVVGYTSSANLPVAGAIQPLLRGIRNAFVAKLNAGGTALLFGTFLGGSISDSAAGLALDANGSIYVAGNTSSADFPVLNAAQSIKSGQQDGFIAKLSSTGTLLYSTYLGGSSADTVTALAVDSAGAAYVAGNTMSTDFPLLSAYRGTIPGQQAGFVTKLSSTGRALVYSTFLGGSSGGLQLPEGATAIAVDSSGAAYVAGVTSSTNFPVVNPYLVLSGGGTHGYLTKFTPAGNVLAFSTYFGGSGRDWPLGVALKTDGSIYLCGYTSSSDLPVLNAIQKSNGGIYDAFWARFNASGALVNSSYLGGSSIDAANAVATAASGNVFIAGHTMSSDFPLASPAQSRNPSNYSAFLAKIADPDQPPPPPSDPCAFGRSRNLVKQNQTTREVMLYCYGGPGGTTLLGTNWLYRGSGALGWTVAGLGDFNRDGVPDLVWQHDSTGQVVVHYYGGSSGLVDLGWNWLYPYVVAGWHVVAAADFNRDGVADIVWQNDTTGQVTVHYYGGPGGATDLGWNWLYSATDGAGWHIAAVADFNGDGTPDLLWQHNVTRIVVIHYRGGPSGELYLGWDWLYTRSDAIGWRLAGVMDLNLDGMQDLVWQHDSTAQIVVHYYRGNNDAGWNWVDTAVTPEWLIVN